MPPKKIFVASDHEGFGLKEALVPFLAERGYEVEDLGPSSYEKEDDYPDLIAPLARAVAAQKGSFGIAIGLSGEGEAMAANRHPGIRAAVYYGASRNKNVLALSREHNDANVLSLGAGCLTTQEAKDAVIAWLLTDFSGEERHARRIARLDTIVDHG